MVTFINKSQNLQKSYKACCASSHRWRDIKVMEYNFARSIVFAMLSFDGKYQIYKKFPYAFCAGSYRFRDINFVNFLPSQSWSRSMGTISAVTSFNGKDKNLQTLFFIFLIFAKNDCNTHTQTYTETSKAKAIGEIADMPKKCGILLIL